VPRRPKDSPPPDPQQIIDDQAREIERLREDLKRSEIERNRLRRENERVKEELEAARRQATRQAAPFSRGLPKEHPSAPPVQRPIVHEFRVAIR
jgi:septal ring factor EnvC (AmiA/AmiB activator)